MHFPLLGLVEIFDLGDGLSPRLINGSTRHRIGAGADALVAGFVVDGVGEKTLLIRGIGPTLAAPPFNLPGTIADPKLEIYDQTRHLLAENDNWPPTLATVFSRVAAFALVPDSKDAALVITLPPGAYSAQLTNPTGPAGDGMIEIYEVP